MGLIEERAAKQARLAKIFMESCDEHIARLKELYPEFVPDQDVVTAYRAISHTGLILVAINREDHVAMDLIKVAAHAAQLTREGRYAQLEKPVGRQEEKSDPDKKVEGQPAP